MTAERTVRGLLKGGNFWNGKAESGKRTESFRILLVDDDLAVLDMLAAHFTAAGYQVLRTGSGAEAMEMIRQVRLDCVILDVGLPDWDGFDVCTQVRKSTAVPIIFLSCFTEEESRVRGLAIGGDDYVCKPFSIRELELRVQARIQSRQTHRPAVVMEFGDLTIDTGSRTVAYRDRIGDFSRIEFDILSFLARNPNRVFSYEQIYDGIWQEPLGKSRHNLQARVASMRQKLAELCPDREYIRTVRRKGYGFTP